MPTRARPRRAARSPRARCAVPTSRRRANRRGDASTSVSFAKTCYLGTALLIGNIDLRQRLLHECTGGDRELGSRVDRRIQPAETSPGKGLLIRQQLFKVSFVTISTLVAR